MSEWTVDTLRTYFEQRLEDQQRAVDAALIATKEASAAALASAKEAVLKAEGATDRRFDAVNEFRGALSDQTAEFPRRSEVNLKFSALEKSLADIDKRITTVEAVATGQGGSWMKLLQVVSLLGALLAIYFSLSK